MPVSMREVTRDVWNNNLDDAMRDLRRLVDAFPYIAIDCEFPAVVARPIGKFKTSTDYHYQTMRCNVDILKLIQLGITLVNDDGAVAQDCTWQFNFYFNTDEDTYEPSSIEALSKAGLDFARHRTNGIEPAVFAELMITSGLVLNEDTTWISYHGAYDFGYLLRMLTGAPLPLTEEDFFHLIKTWFPALYDIKYIMRQIKPTLKGGLTDIATDLGVTPSFGPPPVPQSTNANMHSSMMQQQQPALFTSGYASFLAATTFHHIIDHYVLPSAPNGGGSSTSGSTNPPGRSSTNTPTGSRNVPAPTQWDISAFQGALYGLGSTYVGVIDVGGRGLTGAERERPGVGSSNANNNNVSSAANANSALSGMGGMSSMMGMGGMSGISMSAMNSGIGLGSGLGGVMSPNALHHSSASHHLGLGGGGGGGSGGGAFVGMTGGGGAQSQVQAQAQAQREYAQQIQAVAAAAQAQAAAAAVAAGIGAGAGAGGHVGGMGALGPMGALSGLGGSMGMGGMGMGGMSGMSGMSSMGGSMGLGGMSGMGMGGMGSMSGMGGMGGMSGMGGMGGGVHPGWNGHHHANPYAHHPASGGAAQSGSAADRSSNLRDTRDARDARERGDTRDNTPGPGAGSGAGGVQTPSGAQGGANATSQSQGNGPQGGQGGAGYGMGPGGAYVGYGGGTGAGGAAGGSGGYGMSYYSRDR